MRRPSRSTRSYQSTPLAAKLAEQSFEQAWLHRDQLLLAKPVTIGRGTPVKGVKPVCAIAV